MSDESDKEMEELVLNHYEETIKNIQWIKCSDRLPNDNGYYLVYETFNNRVGDDYFFHNGSGDHWKLFHEYVTHWMPLPEPPTGE